MNHLNTWIPLHSLHIDRPFPEHLSHLKYSSARHLKHFSNVTLPSGWLIVINLSPKHLKHFALPLIQTKIYIKLNMFKLNHILSIILNKPEHLNSPYDLHLKHGLINKIKVLDDLFCYHFHYKKLKYPK